MYMHTIIESTEQHMKDTKTKLTSVYDTYSDCNDTKNAILPFHITMPIHTALTDS